MKTTQNVFRFALLLAVALAATLNHSAYAANTTWVGNTDANFGTLANWNSVTPNGNSPIFGAAGNAGATLNNDISGATYWGLVFNSGASAYTISGNSFTLGNATSINNNSSSLQTVNTDITLFNSAHTFNATSGNITLGGALSGTSGTLTFTGANTTTLGGTNTLTTTGANYAGLVVTGNLSITGATTVDGSGFTDSRGVFDVHGNASLTVQTGGSLTFTSGTSAGLSIVGQNANGTSTLLVNGGSLTLNPNQGIAFGNNIAGATGVLTVSSGTATIAAGSTTLQDQRNFIALGRDNATGTINLNGGTLATGRQFVRDGSSGGTVGAGTATFSFNGGTLQALASQTSGSGWFETATTGNYQVVTTTVNSGGAIIDCNGFNVNINTVLAHGTGTPDGGLTKNGAGTLTLSGSNTYTGNTTVNGGTLKIGTGGSLASPNISVSSGAIYDVSTAGGTLVANQNILGSGVVTGAVTTASTSKIYAGTDGAAGTLSFSNNVTMTSGSTLNLDVSTSASSGNDKVVVSGALALNTTTFNVKALSGASDLDTTADYVLVTASGISGTPNAALNWVGTAPANAASFTVVQDGNTIVLRYTAANPPIITSATANPATLTHGQSTLITAAVTPGDAALTSVTVSGSALTGTVTLISDGAGNYTNNATISAGTAAGSQTLTVLATDANALVASSNITVTVLAQNEVWNGGGSDNKWTTGANWDSGLQPGTGDSVAFAGSAQVINNLDASVSLASLTFNSGAGSFTVTNAANTLTLTGGMTNNSANIQTLDVPLALSGSQTVNAASGDITVSRAVSGSGSDLTKVGSGTLTFSGVNTYSGATTIGNGLLTIGGAGQLGGGSYSGNITNNGALNVGSSASQTLSGTISGTGSLTNSGSGTLTLNGANTYNGGTTLSNGTLTIGNNSAFGTGTLTLNGGTLKAATTSDWALTNSISVGGSTTIDMNSKNVNLNGNLSGSAAVSVAHSGATASTLTLAGDNSGYTGTITFSAAGNGNAVGFTSATAGSASAAWVFNDANLDRVRISIAGGGTVNFGSISGSGQMQNDTAGTASIISVGALNTSTTFSGTIKDNGTGTLALTKVGTGTLTLSGTSTYSGTTTVSAGTLLVNGSTASGSAVTVANATLGGSGAINGSVTVNSGGTFAPGTNGVGTLNLGNGLTLNAGAISSYTLGTSSTTAAVTGNLALNGTLNVTAGAGFGVGTYTLATYTGTLSGAWTLGTTPAGYSYAVNTGTAGQVNLVVGYPWTVSPASYAFGSVATDAIPQATFTITNFSGTTVNGTASVGTTAFSIVSGSPFSVADGSTATVTVQFAPTTPGSNYTDSVQFSSGAQTVNLPVTGTGLDYPVANFSGTPTTGPAPLPVTFTDTSYGGATNRFWNFGDGSTTNTLATTVQHTYARSGRWTVTLVTANQLGASTNSKPNYIITAPVLRILTVGDSITAGASVPSAIPGGYRLPLYQLFTNLNYNVIFTGTTSANPVPGLNFYHEGHGSAEIAGVNALMEGVFDNTDDPDIILLLLGTNDYGIGPSAGATNRLDAMISNLATNRPNAKIIVANLLIRGDSTNLDTQIQTTFNPFIPGIVAAHAALGQQVYFTDMRSAVPTNNLSDGIHPTATGYAQMATNWFTAVTNLFGVFGSTNAPVIARVTSPMGLTNVVVTFSKPVADSAANLANFSLSGGVTISAAMLDVATRRVVTITTSPLTKNAGYTLTATNIVDITDAATPIAPDTTATFTASAVRGATNNVAEAAHFQLAYSLDIPNAPSYPGSATYTVDNHASLGAYGRVAYYMELQSTNAGPLQNVLQYVWVSMNPFTTNINKIGIPTVASGAVFQQPVTNMNVASSMPGITSGTGLNGGNLQFWPYNYSIDATTGVYDWNNVNTGSGNYGSMKIANTNAAQMLLSFNRWGGNGGNADLGIGNNRLYDHAFDQNGVHVNALTAINPDWTFLTNAANYSVKTLQVFIQPVPVPGATNISAVMGYPRIIAASDLAAIAGNPANYPLTVTAVSATSTNGSSVTLGGGNITYTPSALGTDAFTYTLSDGNGGTNTGWVSIVVSNAVIVQITGQLTSFAGGVANLTFHGIPNYNYINSYITERSTNLADWVDLVTNSVATNGVISVTDTFGDLGGVPPASAYYRLKWQP